MKNEQGLSLLNHEVIKPSGVIHIEHRINMLEQQIWNVLFRNAFNLLDQKDEFQIRTRDLLKIFPYECQNVAHIKKCLKGLMGTVVEFNIFDKDKKMWGAFTLLSDANIKDGICTYSYGKELHRRMCHPEMYTKINLLIQQRFKTKYALFIYELCLDYCKIGQTPKMEIEKFKHYLGLKNDQYILFKDFNKYILKPSIKEINKETELFIDLEKEKEKRRVVSLKFYIKPNPKKPISTMQDSLFAVEESIHLLGENDETTQKLKSLNLSKKKIEEILKIYEPDKIKLALKITKEKSTENKAGYFLELLKDPDFGEKEKKQKQRKEARQKKELEEFEKRSQEEKQQVEERKKVDEFIEKNAQDYDELVKQYIQSYAGKLNLPEKTIFNLAKGNARAEISKKLRETSQV